MTSEYNDNSDSDKQKSIFHHKNVKRMPLQVPYNIFGKNIFGTDPSPFTYIITKIINIQVDFYRLFSYISKYILIHLT